MSIRAKIARLFVLLAVMLTVVSIARAQAIRKQYMTFMMNNAVGEPIATELRLDTVAMWDLDLRLQQYGITDSAVRSWIYTAELTRRNSHGTGQGAAPEGYPAPQTQVDVIASLPLGCFKGQGCHVIWEGAGWMRSHFQEITGRWMPWTNGIRCPAGKVCSVLASIPADMSQPAVNQRHYVTFGTSSFGFPVFLGSKCFWVV